ncbi:MAG TPA: NUDIX domain-containing protein [Candidatus Saccharimonadales bacterium]|nr:NUDIX domain-containing protein [Candidatus Saccharimonadales bacterium]
MHVIQRKILGKLLYASSLGYAQLRPAGVESNHFAYHLEQLVKTKLVGKKDKAYFLAPQGLAYVDRMSQGKMVERMQPHIVTAVDITTPGGKTLVFKRNFQPYFHLIGFPSGKLHYEEPILDAAVRELAEKTALTDIPLKHRGMVYIQAATKGVTIGRVLYHIFHAEVAEELPVSTPELRGETYWADHRALDPADCMPGFLHLKELLQENSDTLFFEEISTKL